MNEEKNPISEEMNVLRFYIDDNDKIYKCDYIENFDMLVHETIALPLNELNRVFKKYINKDEIYHEEKVYRDFILFKFYDVDINEIYDLIKRSKMFQRYESSKFKTYNKPQENERTREIPQRVTRKNRFSGKKVLATAATIAVLLSAGKMILTIPNEKSIESKETITTEAQTYENSSNYEFESNESNYDISSQYDQYINIETEDWTNTEKYKNVMENYYDLIYKYSKIYGIDPKIAVAIACHERGTHSEEVDDGGGLGLYQIQIEGRFNWDNADVYAYNFETNQTEKYTIHKDEVRNLEENIKAGIMIFQECLRRNDYDIAASIQEYNYGYGNLQDVMAECYTESNPRTNENRLEWLNYRTLISGGDPHYLENVLKFVESGSEFEFMRKDGTTVTARFDNASLTSAIKNRL